MFVVDELELNPGGLNEETARKHIFQVLKAIAFCHANSVSTLDHRMLFFSFVCLKGLLTKISNFHSRFRMEIFENRSNVKFRAI